ncbi:AAA family ATPase [Pseudomonadota bacterium]
MLKKITSIQNVGKFKNAGAAGDTAFDEHTMIYAPNGYGKTTLCTILRSLSENDPNHVIGRKTLGSPNDPKVEILMQGAGAVFDQGTWNMGLPAIAVFDGTFVAENVYSGDAVDIDHKRNLYRVIVGRDGVGLAQQEVQLAAQSKAQTKAVSSAQKVVNAHVPERMALDKFLALPNDPDVDTKIEAAEAEVATAQQADNIKTQAALAHLPVPGIPENFDALLTKSLDGVEKDVEELVSTHIADHGMEEDGQAWIAKGIQYEGDESCPYCGQGVDGVALINAYQTLFGDAYKQLKDEVQALSDELENAIGDRAIGAALSVVEQNKGAVEFWGNHCDIDPNDLVSPVGYDVALTKLRQAALKLSTLKAGALLEPLAVDDNFQTAKGEFDKTLAIVRDYNAFIDRANVKIQIAKDGADEADLLAAQLRLSLLRAGKLRHEPAVSSACDAYVTAAGEKGRIETRKANVRKALDKHTAAVIRPYENKINSYLDSFNAGFRIAETSHGYPGGTAASSYRIVINDTNIDLGSSNSAVGEPSFKNTLSAGDRSTLALAFFLAHIDHDPDIANRIVTFDDPFNSQDRFRRNQTVHEIIKKGKECAQVIVLSHDENFLKQVWEKCPRDKRKSLQITNLMSQGTKIMPFDMGEACKGRAATELNDLQEFVSNRSGKANDIIKKVRVVLETYCRSTYSASFKGDDNLGGIIKNIREGGEEHPAHPILDELDQINDYTCDHHHGEDPENDDDTDQIDLDELTGYVRRSLRIANAMPS